MAYSRTRTADVVLYLDLDGVVHHEAVYWHPRRGIYMHPHVKGRTLFEWVPYLEEAVLPYPDLALVLSSSWCVRPGYGKTLKRFPLALQQRFIGGTFHKLYHHGGDPMMLQSFRETPRGLQILHDVQRRRPRQWLALDDDDYHWPAKSLGNLVLCDGERGLSDPRVREQLALKLRRCYDALDANHG
jgi:hypothetical protein